MTAEERDRLVSALVEDALRALRSLSMNDEQLLMAWLRQAFRSGIVGFENLSDRELSLLKQTGSAIRFEGLHREV